MRRAARIDRNQPEIVAALRAVGAGVVSLAPVGDGLTDLLVGFRGANFLIEVKDGEKPPSERCLNDVQQEFHDNWPGQVAVAETVDEALQAIGAIHA